MSEKTTTKLPARPAASGGRRRGPHGPGGGGMPGAKALNFRGSLKRLFGELLPEKVALIFMVILAAVSVTLSVIGPKILGRATDQIFNGYIGKTVADLAAQQGIPQSQLSKDMVLQALNSGQIQGMTSEQAKQMADMLAGMEPRWAGIDFTMLGRILLICIAIYCCSALFGYLQGRLTARIVNRTMYRLRQRIEEKISRLPLKYFDGQQPGEVLSRTTNDIDNIAQSLQQTMMQLISSVLTVIGVLIMMLTISWKLTLIALLTLPIVILLTTLIAKRSQPQFMAQWAHTGELNAHIEEMYTGHTLVKVYGHQSRAIEEFDEKNGKLFSASFKAQFISGIIQPVMMFVGNLGFVVVAVVGGIQVASGQITLGNVQAFTQYMRQFTQPITQVASMMNLLQSAVASAERVFELLDEPEQSPDPVPGAEIETELRGSVRFNDVSFSYDPAKPLIENLNLHVHPGQTVAIVGHTGAGKTTLVNLLERFYELDGGSITLDMVNIGEMNREYLRSKTGMVLQDTWLFHGTIRENIAYGAKNPTEEQIMAAAKATYVDRFVRSLPDGYDTVIDEEGSNVSAGEKQLITIARAFLSNPLILILDEATSSVDTRTELLVQRAMNKLRDGRTSFVIAHRLSTIRDADKILVMEHGSIVEQGNHDELMALDGAYAELYNSQFSGAVAPVE